MHPVGLWWLFSVWCYCSNQCIHFLVWLDQITLKRYFFLVDLIPQRALIKVKSLQIEGSFSGHYFCYFAVKIRWFNRLCGVTLGRDFHESQSSFLAMRGTSAVFKIIFYYIASLVNFLQKYVLHIQPIILSPSEECIT